MVLPYLGFPSTWDNIIYIFIGLLIIFLAYKVNFTRMMNKDEKESLPFVEHKKESLFPSPTTRDETIINRPLSEI